MFIPEEDVICSLGQHYIAGVNCYAFWNGLQDGFVTTVDGHKVRYDGDIRNHTPDITQLL